MQTPVPSESRHRSADDESQPEVKRRKLRKGTTSCWECKKRKTKCEANPQNPKICLGCVQRGTKCISQEFNPEVKPESNPGASDPPSEPPIFSDRLSRLEKMLQKVVEKVIPEGIDDFWPDGFPRPGEDRGSLEDEQKCSDSIDCVDTPTSLFFSAVVTEKSKDSPASDQKSPACPVPRSVTPRYQKLSQALYEHLPCQHDANFEAMIAGKAKTPCALALLPAPSSHPVLLARALMQLALAIQLLPSHFDYKTLRMKEPAQRAMKRYFEVASNLVSSNDELIGSLEGLELLALEGIFQINAANLRRGWLLYRRAISLAQLLGIHRGDGRAITTLDPTSIASPPCMWRKIVHVDRYLALILGLPAGCPNSRLEDTPIEPSEGDCYFSRVEQIQSLVAARIIERNEQVACDDYAITQEIDLHFKAMMKDIPSQWWPIPYLAASAGTDQELKDLMRIMSQITHYNLIVLLHLPYMLRVSKERRYDYSKITCINASRDLLTRFIAFRSFAFSSFTCRGVDLTAFTGALTLLLAHLDNRRNNYGMEQLLSAKRLSDLALVEQTIALVLDGGATQNVVSEQITTVLRRILAIEADSSNDDGSLRLVVPFYGEITIVKGGIVRSSSAPTNLTAAVGPVIAAEFRPRSAFTASNASPAAVNSAPDPRTHPSLNGNAPAFGLQAQSWPLLGGSQWNMFSGAMDPNPVQVMGLQDNPFPMEVTAEVDKWALQGVDANFFDNLLRGNGNGPYV